MDGTAEELALSLYRYPAGIPLADTQIRLSGGKGCSWEISEDKLVIHCPQGEDCTVEVAYRDTACSITVSRPSAAKYRLMKTAQDLDAYLVGHPNTILSFEGQVSYYKALFTRISRKLGFLS